LKIRQIKEILDAQIYCGQDMLEIDINSACGSDLMSDLLAFVKDSCVLLTGQNNPQVIKTAEMLDVECIVFVRGKKPLDSVCKLADEVGIAILQTEKTLYAACGQLYEKGLKPCERCNY
jgi:predicted transcriptional regulator